MRSGVEFIPPTAIVALCAILHIELITTQEQIQNQKWYFWSCIILSGIEFNQVLTCLTIEVH